MHSPGAVLGNPPATTKDFQHSVIDADGAVDEMELSSMMRREAAGPSPPDVRSGAAGEQEGNSAEDLQDFPEAPAPPYQDSSSSRLPHRGPQYSPPHDLGELSQHPHHIVSPPRPIGGPQGHHASAELLEKSQTVLQELPEFGEGPAPAPDTQIREDAALPAVPLHAFFVEEAPAVEVAAEAPAPPSEPADRLAISDPVHQLEKRIPDGSDTAVTMSGVEEAPSGDHPADGSDSAPFSFGAQAANTVGEDAESSAATGSSPQLGDMPRLMSLDASVGAPSNMPGPVSLLQGAGVGSIDEIGSTHESKLTDREQGQSKEGLRAKYQLEQETGARIQSEAHAHLAELAGQRNDAVSLVNDGKDRYEKSLKDEVIAVQQRAALKHYADKEFGSLLDGAV